MKTANHLVGGFVLTGSSVSLFFGINILESLPLLGVTAVASLLPDVDHTQSIIGKALHPISKWTNRRFGHRTLTHGLPFLIMFLLLISAIESFYSMEYTFTKVFGLAYWYHIFLDMFTVSGVKLMYPLQKDKTFVMIGRKDLRIRTDDYRAEAVAMFIFIILGISLIPLMQNGFWTTYNSFFGKPMHLVSEFEKSDDLMLVEYQIKKGSEQFQGKGYCIEASTSKIVMLEDEKWKIIDAKEYIIDRVIPIHTSKQFRFEATNVIDITADSLNQIVMKAPITNIHIAANNEFKYFQNGIEHQDKKLKADYLNDLYFQEISEVPEVEVFTPDQSHIAKIATLQQQINLIKANQEAKFQAYQATQNQVERLRNDYALSTDLTKKEEIIKEIRILEKAKAPTLDDSQIANLQLKIQEIKTQTNLKNQSQQTQIKLKNQATAAAITDTRFTGIITHVVITNPSLASKE